jgi:hypothetical protein
MNKRISLLAGIALILMGVLALASNLILSLLGVEMWRWGLWRFWPILVVGLGGLFLRWALRTNKRVGSVLLLILGLPTLVSGAILLVTSLFGVWHAWEWLWPLEILALGLGFLVAAAYVRAIWLLVPAIIIGANGLLFQFCAITGWWEIWSVLWAIEPLSVGLALLVIGTAKHLRGLLLAGAIVFGLGGVSLVGMTAIVAPKTLLPGLWLFNWVGPLAFIIAGILLVRANLRRHSAARQPAAASPETAR